MASKGTVGNGDAGISYSDDNNPDIGEFNGKREGGSVGVLTITEESEDGEVNIDLKKSETSAPYDSTSDGTKSDYDKALSEVEGAKDFQRMINDLHDRGFNSYEDYEPVIKWYEAMRERNDEWMSKSKREQDLADKEVNDIIDREMNIYQNNPDAFIASSGYDLHQNSYRGKYGFEGNVGSVSDTRRLNLTNPLPKLKKGQMYLVTDMMNGATLAISYNQQKHINIYAPPTNTLGNEQVVFEGANIQRHLGSSRIYLANTTQYEAPRQSKDSYEFYEYENYPRMVSTPIKKYEKYYDGLAGTRGSSRANAVVDINNPHKRLH